MAVEDANALSRLHFEIEAPAVGEQARRWTRKRIVVALDVDDAAPLPSPAFRQLRELRHKLFFTRALNLPEAVDHVAVHHHQLRVFNGFGEVTEPVRVMSRTDRPAEVDVGKQQSTLHTPGDRHSEGVSTAGRGLPPRGSATS